MSVTWKIVGTLFSNWIMYAVAFRGCCSFLFPAHYVWYSWFWSHLKMSKNVFFVVAWLPQRLKSTLFEIFYHSTGPFWGRQYIVPRGENETKIVKITHNAAPTTYISLDFAPFCRQVSSVFLPKKALFCYLLLLATAVPSS